MLFDHLRPNTGMKVKRPPGGGKTQWHTAFFQAIQQELFDYRDSLEFKYEHPLAEEPLRIDLLIIKKPKNLTINKNIARIFRADNLLEYKSPGDYLAVSDFLKVNAYANLYAAITPSVDFADYLPIQIIESRKLPERENLWLKSLTKDLQAVSAGSIINEVRKPGDKAPLGAYLNVLWRANPRAFSEVENMAKRKRETFEEVYTKNGVIPGYIEQGRVQGLVTAARNAMNKGLPIDVIHDITGLDIETIQKLAMSKQQG